MILKNAAVTTKPDTRSGPRPSTLLRLNDSRRPTASDSKTLLWAFQSRKLGHEIEISGWPIFDSWRVTMRCASGYGSGRSKTALTMLKIAVFAPMPSASVRTATRVNPGDLRSWRRANLRSLILFCSQRDYRIDAYGAAGWYKTGKQSSDGKSCGSNGNQKR